MSRPATPFRELRQRPTSVSVPNSPKRSATPVANAKTTPKNRRKSTSALSQSVVLGKKKATSKRVETGTSKKNAKPNQKKKPTTGDNDYKYKKHVYAKRKAIQKLKARLETQLFSTKQKRKSARLSNQEPDTPPVEMQPPQLPSNYNVDCIKIVEIKSEADMDIGENILVDSCASGGPELAPQPFITNLCPILDTNGTEADGGLLHFFLTMYNTTRTFPSITQCRIKSKIFQVVSETEMDLLTLNMTRAN